MGEYNATSGAAINANLIPGGVGFAQGILVSGNTLFVGVENSRAIGEYNATTGATINANFTNSVLQGNPEGLAIAGNTLFLTNTNGNETVGAYNATTGATINANILSGVSNPFGLAVSGNTLFVTNVGNNTVGAYNATTGATINASLISGLSQPNGIVVFGNTLFVGNVSTGNVGSGTVGEYNATTGATISASFITGLTDPFGLAISGNDLFVTNYSISGDTVREYNATTGALINANFITGIINPIGLTAVALPATNWLGEMDGTWTGNNWASDSTGTPTTAIPTSAGDIIFSATGAANQGNTTLGANFTIHSLTISNSAAVVINSGGAFSLTISGNAGTGINVASGAGLLTINANVTFAGSSNTITISNTAGAIINGIVSGSIGLDKEGTGTLILNGANTYTGGTTISSGILKIGNATALGGSSGAISVATGAVLDLNGTTMTSLNALTLNGVGNSTGGALTNSSATAGTYAGLITLGSASAIIASSGNIILSNTGTITGSGFGLTLGGSATGNSIASVIGTGAGTLTVSGGTWTLSGASTYTGATTVSAGTIADGINNALPTATTLSVAGSLNLAGFNQQVASVTGSGTVTDSGGAATFTVNNSGADSFAGTFTGTNLSLTKSGVGTLTLTGSSTYGGATTISAGTIKDGTTVALPSGTALAVTGTLDLSGFNQGVGSVTGTGTVTNSGAAATFTVNNAATDTFAGTITGANMAIEKDGAGTLILTAASTYGGQTVAGAGTTQLGISNALPTGTRLVVNGILDLAGFNQQVGSLVGLGFVTDSGAAATFTVNNAATDSSNSTLSGNLAFTKTGAGAFILTNFVSYTGATDVQGGLLQVDGSIMNSAVTVENGATLGGKGSVTNAVTIKSGGILAPGDTTGVLSVSSLTLNSGSFSNYQLGAPGVPSMFSTANDLTIVSGNLTLGGTLNVADAGGFGPGAYQLFQYNGSLTNNTLAIGNVPAGYNASNFVLVTGVAREVDLIVLANGGAATTQFWDGNGTANNGSIDGGSGTWSNFTTKFADSTGNNNATWQNGIAVFDRPLGGGTPGTVTLSGAINFAGLMFTTSGYSIVSNGVAGTSFTAIGTPTNANNVASISTGSGVTATIGAVIGGTAGISKDGAGTLILSGANTYSGGTTITGGVLQISSDGNLGNTSGGATLNGGTLQATSLIFTNRTITLGTNGGTIATSGNTQFFIDGLITGSGPLNLSSPSVGAAAIVFAGTTDNNYTGLTTVQTGFVELSATGHVAISGDVTVNSGGELTDNTSGQIAAAATLTNNGFFNFNGSSAVTQTIGTLLGNGNIYSTTASGGTLTVGAGNYTGMIFDNSGPMALVKQSAGTLILSGSNTYSGTTSVQGGLLQVDGSLGNTAVTVQSGATLGGKGVITGAVTILSGGILAPGDSPGTLTVGSLTLNSGSISNYQLGTPGVIGSNVNDLTVVNGNLVLGGTLNLANAGGFGPGAYQIVQYTGSLTNNTLAVGTVPAGFTAASNFIVVTGVAHQVDLIVVPNGGAATTQFWDGTGPANNGSIDGGSGTWSNFTANFADSTGNNNAAWQNGIAVFDRPLGAGDPGTVTVSGPINFAGLMFTTSGYTINSDGAAGTSFTAIGTPTNATNIASIATNSGVTATVNAVIGGSAGISKDGGGTLILNAANTYGGGTVLNAGTLGIGNDNALSNGAVVVAAGGGSIFASGAAHTLSNSITLNGGLTVVDDPNGAHTLTLAGPITGSGSLTMNGTGTLILTHSNGYGGGTNLNSGTLGIGNDSALGSAGVTVAATGGSIFASGADHTVTNGFMLNGGLTVMNDPNGAHNLTLNGQLTGGGSLTMNGTGTLTLGAANTYAGATAINSGTIKAGIGNALPTSTEVILGTAASTVTGTLDLNGSNQAVNSINLAAGNTGGAGNVITSNSGASTLTVSSTTTNSVFGGLLKDGGAGTLALIKDGAGATLALTAGNTYSGGTTIKGGALLANNLTGLATGSGMTTVIGGGTLGGNGTVGDVTLSAGGVIAPGAAAAGISTATLHAASLMWNGGGQVNLQLGAGSDLLALAGALTKGAPGSYTLNITDAGGLGNQSAYTLATFGSTTFNATDFSLALPAGYSALLLETATGLQIALSFAGAGPVIQNSAPVGTPMIADFTVNGPVVTGPGTGNNTIRSLIFTPGSSLQIFNTLTLSSGQVSDGGGSSTITGGTLAGPNALFFNIIGSMEVSSTLLGNLTKTGTGALYVDGTLVGNAQVLAGLLGGHGTITGNLFNAGTVSPGNSPGTLHVGGNFTQAPGGTLIAEIAGGAPADHDLLQIAGHASLDGTLQLVKLGNGPKLKLGEQITFLTANQGVSGKFATVINPFTSDTIVEPMVVYVGNSVELEGVQGSFRTFADNAGLTPNQRAVAEALDSAAFNPRAGKMIAYLDNRTLEKLPGDLERISPDALTSIFQIGTSFANVQSLNLQRRAEDIRSGSNGFSAAGFAMNSDSPSYSGGLGFAGPAGPTGTDDKESKTVSASVPDARWGAFLSGTGEWVKVGDTENARGYDLQTGGFTLGLDYKVTPHLAIGVSAGYAGTGVDLANGGRVFVNGGKLGVYGAYFDGGFYVDGAVNGGYSSYDTHRSGLEGSARGNTDGGELNAMFATGYDWKKGALTFGPTATFNYTNVRMNRFQEDGSLAPLDIHGGNGESLRSAFGMKASYDWKVGSVAIKPEVRVAWQHEFGASAYSLDSDLASGAGNVFTTSGPTIGRDSLLLSGGFAIQWNERCSTYLYYDGELARTNYQSSSVTGGFRVAF